MSVAGRGFGYGAAVMASDFDIAIIGAGAAGIGAARRLAGSGHSTIVIEASARVGGRAETLECAGMPLDLGCGWLHSAERNSWARIAVETGFAVDHRTAVWGAQFEDRGFSRAERAEAGRAYDEWYARLESHPPASDRASDALEPDSPWNGYIQAISGYLNGATLDRVSVADYRAYDEASTYANWRVPAGYGTLVAASLPPEIGLRLATPVGAIALTPDGVTLTTPRGDIRARAAILTVSTAVLTAGAIRLPSELDAWRRAAEVLPLGRNEKLFFEITDPNAFAPESHVIANPRDPRSGSYYIRAFGQPVIEVFLGGPGAEALEAGGPAAGFAHAIQDLTAIFGADPIRRLRPLVASDWARMDRIGGGYSHALPGHRGARKILAQPFDGRLFFAGEATHSFDFSTAHGAHDTGVRSAEEALAVLGRGR